MVFSDRRHAGRALAKLVAAEGVNADAVVLGLPRGGVPVAYEIAHTCALPLDVLVVRKLGAPGAPELAMGALASGGDVVWNVDVLRSLHVSRQELYQTVERERAELNRRERVYREGRPPIPIAERPIILVDDGLATGASMRVAIRTVQEFASHVTVAVPVGAQSTCEELEHDGIHVLCLERAANFGAVGMYYEDFSPTTDEEVRLLLTKARKEFALQSARDQTST